MQVCWWLQYSFLLYNLFKCITERQASLANICEWKLDQNNFQRYVGISRNNVYTLTQIKTGENYITEQQITVEICAVHLHSVFSYLSPVNMPGFSEAAFSSFFKASSISSAGIKWEM
jgi:hypothetical protein